MKQAKPKIRLYVNAPFMAGQGVSLAPGQAHYLANVMRKREGDEVVLFNGADGEWLAKIGAIEKKSVALTLRRRLSNQKHSPDIWLAFAPIKNKTELVVEKATELGVSMLLPVFTRHAVVTSINEAKLNATAIEAAEQSERHDVPAIEPRKNMIALLSQWPVDRALLYGDESGGGISLAELLSSFPAKGEGEKKFGILIGPEGGFSADEHKMLKSAPQVKAFGMGPRILRADTAAVAALACAQAWLGDWNEKPHFIIPSIEERGEL